MLKVLYSLEDFKREIEELFEGFYDILLLIKKYTYDIVAEKFGQTGVNILLGGFVVFLLMIILTKIIRH